MPRFHGLVLALIVMACPVAAGEMPPPPESMDEVRAITDAFDADHNHLKALSGLRRLQDKYAHSKPDTHLVSQYLAFHESYVGNEREALRLFTENLFRNHLPRGAADTIPDSVQARALKDVIAELAADARLVLINEAHHVGRHRFTTRSLLESLHALGFRYLAVESLREDAALLERGYPVAESGYYLNEPEFGHLLREALRIGFEPVRYEANNAEDQDARERGQARNIAAVLERDPEARILVHAGYQHIDEAGLLFGAKTMAQHLNAMTGIDPLTINQATLTWIGDSMEPNAVYEAAVRVANGLTDAFILQTDGQPWSLEPDKYDVSVVTPPTRLLDNGLKDWQQDGVRRIKAVDVPAGARMLEARLANESDDAIPLERTLVEADAERVYLALPPGHYRLSWKDNSGEEATTGGLEVSPGQ